MSYVLTSRGLGATAQQYVSAVGSIGAPVGTAALGPALTPLVGPTLAIPIAGAAVAAVLLGLQLILNSGCGQTCIVTSNWANDAETKLRQLAKAYFAIKAPRPQSVQQAAMQGFQDVWNYLYTQCSNPQLGTAGQNCTGDRKDGACKWKQTALLGIPGEPAIGECFNWWAEYYWPIANDPDVVPDSQLQSAAGATVSDLTAGLVTDSGQSLLPLLLLLAAGAGLVALNG